MSNVKRVIYTALLVLFVAGLQLGSGMTRTHYACQICLNKKDEVTTTIFFVPVFKHEGIATGPPFLAGHQHQWHWSGSKKHFGVSLFIYGAP